MISEKIAKYIISFQYENVPEEVVEMTKNCLIDYFASAIAGSMEAPVQMISEMVKEMGGHEQATCITGRQTSVAQAAFVNGAAGHVVELDDIHKQSIIHAATVVIPAALAIAEWKHCSGKELVAAIIVGYEVCYRIGEAVSPSHYFYWHNTATCGTFGATAAAAKLLGLKEGEIIHALGSAGTQAAGLWEFIEDGAMSKQLHPGKAAMNGVISALLAQKGFTGASQIFEGRRGFFEATSEAYDTNRVLKGLGKEFKLMENSYKMHASCRHTHAAMDLAIQLRKEKPFDIEDIEEVIIDTYQVALNITDNENPRSIYAAKFSLQFCVALALAKGKGSLAEFSEESLHDPTIRSLMKKIAVEKSSEIDGQYPEKWGAALQILLKDGSRFEARTDFPKGDPEAPFTTEEFIEKFNSLTENSGLDHIGLLQSLLNVEELSEVNSLFTNLFSSLASK